MCTETVSGIGIRPLHGARALGVVADVAHELSLQIGDRDEHAAGDHVALDSAEPQLHVIEPRGIRCGEVQLHVGVLAEVFLDLLSLVPREIVGDHVDLLAARLVEHDVSEKDSEIARGVARGGLAQDLTGLGVDGDVQGERAMAVILKAVPLEAPRRDSQHRIFTITCLNMRLFVDSEDRCVRGWVEVQPDDVGGLLFNVRTVRGHVALQAAGLETVLEPHPRDHHVTNAQVLTKPASAPVRRAVLPAPVRVASGTRVSSRHVITVAT